MPKSALKQLATRIELPSLLEQRKLNGIGLELGVLQGRYSNTILRHSKLQTLFSVDAWNLGIWHDHAAVQWTQRDLNRFYKETVTRLSKFGPRSVILRMESEEAANLFNEMIFDFIYIDANHGYEQALRDMVLWYPKLKLGGIFAGHDYSERDDLPLDQWGVVKALTEFAEMNDFEYQVTPEKDGTWYGVKRPVVLI